jgi:hypothetical protein
MPDLTTIIVSYNTRPELEACLASLPRQGFPGRHEVIVVDNASTDGTAEAVRTRFPGVRLIEPGRNLGFGAANNVGMQAAGTDLLLLLNSDTIVPAGAVEAMCGAFAEQPGWVALGPRLVDGDGRAELSFGRMMTPWSEWRQKVLVRLHERRVPLVSAWVERATRQARCVDWVSGACLLVRRRDALAVGGFDERYFLYAEDVDFCAALRALGRQIRFFPGAEVVHLRGRSGRQRPEATERAYRRSHLAFYEKHHPRLAPLLHAYLRVRGRHPDRDQ